MDMTSRVEGFDASYDSLKAHSHGQVGDLPNIISQFTDSAAAISPEVFGSGWSDIKAMNSFEFVPINLADRRAVARSAITPRARNEEWEDDIESEEVYEEYLAVCSILPSGGS